MQFKLTPRLRPQIGMKELWGALVPTSGNVQKFEDKFAKKFENEYGTMFSHGRVGIYALLKIWGIEGREVICPAYTCVVVPHAIVLSGNIPVFVDCTSGSWNMGYREVESSITKNTKAIIVTHLFGYPMDTKRIDEIVIRAEEKYGHKIYVIQDVAHSFGCKSDNLLVTKFGDASIFGLNISKTITSVFGGMVITNSASTNSKLKEYRSEFGKKNVFKGFTRLLYLLAILIAFNKYIYSIVNILERLGLLSRFVDYYEEDQINFPKDWDQLPCELEARVGLIQLEKYDSIVKNRINRARHWQDELANENIKFMDELNGSTFSHCAGLVDSREDWLVKYRIMGWQLGILIEYNIPEMKSYVTYSDKKFPNAQYYSKHTVNFPVWRY